MIVSVCLLVGTLVFGRTIGGAKNWIKLGPISIQPSEFVKVMFIIVSAYFLSTERTIRAFLPYLAFTAFCVVILVVSKDLGTALLFALTFDTILFRNRKKAFDFNRCGRSRRRRGWKLLFILSCAH